MSEIREDQKATLSFKVSGNSLKELDCRIKNLQKDRITLAFPQETMDFVNYLGEGEEVSVRIFTPAGVRVFSAVILSSPLEEEFVIEYVEGSIQIQRREYSRVRLNTKVIIERESGENIVTHTIDIGGGGIRFHSDTDFHFEEQVKCRLYLPMQLSSIVAEGAVLKKPHLGPSEYIIIFSRIWESDRDKILKKCFEIEASFYSEA